MIKETVSMGNMGNMGNMGIMGNMGTSSILMANATKIVPLGQNENKGNLLYKLSLSSQMKIKGICYIN